MGGGEGGMRARTVEAVTWLQRSGAAKEWHEPGPGV